MLAAGKLILKSQNAKVQSISDNDYHQEYQYSFFQKLHAKPFFREFSGYC